MPRRATKIRLLGEKKKGRSQTCGGAISEGCNKVTGRRQMIYIRLEVDVEG